MLAAVLLALVAGTIADNYPHQKTYYSYAPHSGSHYGDGYNYGGVTRGIGGGLYGLAYAGGIGDAYSTGYGSGGYYSSGIGSTNTYGTGARKYVSSYKPKSYSSSYNTNPARISFTLGSSGYDTGSSYGSTGFKEVTPVQTYTSYKPAPVVAKYVAKPAPMVTYVEEPQNDYYEEVVQRPVEEVTKYTTVVKEAEPTYTAVHVPEPTYVEQAPVVTKYTQVVKEPEPTYIAVQKPAPVVKYTTVVKEPEPTYVVQQPAPVVTKYTSVVKEPEPTYTSVVVPAAPRYEPAPVKYTVVEEAQPRYTSVVVPAAPTYTKTAPVVTKYTSVVKQAEPYTSVVTPVVSGYSSSNYGYPAYSYTSGNYPSYTYSSPSLINAYSYGGYPSYGNTYGTSYGSYPQSYGFSNYKK